jgi:hypothetical protein
MIPAEGVEAEVEAEALQELDEVLLLLRWCLLVHLLWAQWPQA